MQCFLRDADAARRHGSERVTNWVVDVRAAAYEAEDALEDGETADKFGVCINGIVNRLSPCSETIKALHCD
jgi:hypothetical protein